MEASSRRWVPPHPVKGSGADSRPPTGGGGLGASSEEGGSMWNCVARYVYVAFSDSGVPTKIKLYNSDDPTNEKSRETLAVEALDALRVCRGRGQAWITDPETIAWKQDEEFPSSYVVGTLDAASTRVLESEAEHALRALALQHDAFARAAKEGYPVAAAMLQELASKLAVTVCKDFSGPKVHAEITDRSFAVAHWRDASPPTPIHFKLLDHVERTVRLANETMPKAVGRWVASRILHMRASERTYDVTMVLATLDGPENHSTLFPIEIEFSFEHEHEAHRPNGGDQ